MLLFEPRQYEAELCQEQKFYVQAVFVAYIMRSDSCSGI